MKRFTLYGSPYSLPTYKVATLLHMSGHPFSFRYVSFQKGVHKTPEFRTLSRWGQVPVLWRTYTVMDMMSFILPPAASSRSLNFWKINLA